MVQKNGPLVSVVVVAVGGLIGAAFAAPFTSHAVVVMRPGYSTADAVCDCLILAVGTILGAAFFSWASKR
jgi:hypothetical protein